MSWTAKDWTARWASDVITKVSDTETSDANTMTDPKGKATSVTISCKKNPS